MHPRGLERFNLHPSQLQYEYDALYLIPELSFGGIFETPRHWAEAVGKITNLGVVPWLEREIGSRKGREEVFITQVEKALVEGAARIARRDESNRDLDIRHRIGDALLAVMDIQAMKHPDTHITIPGEIFRAIATPVEWRYLKPDQRKDEVTHTLKLWQAVLRAIDQKAQPDTNSAWVFVGSTLVRRDDLKRHVTAEFLGFLTLGWSEQDEAETPEGNPIGLLWNYADQDDVPALVTGIITLVGSQTHTADHKNFYILPHMPFRFARTFIEIADNLQSLPDREFDQVFRIVFDTLIWDLNHRNLTPEEFEQKIYSDTGFELKNFYKNQPEFVRALQQYIETHLATDHGRHSASPQEYQVLLYLSQMCSYMNTGEQSDLDTLVKASEFHVVPEVKYFWMQRVAQVLKEGEGHSSVRGSMAWLQNRAIVKLFPHELTEKTPVYWQMIMKVGSVPQGISWLARALLPEHRDMYGDIAMIAFIDGCAVRLSEVIRKGKEKWIIRSVQALARMIDGKRSDFKRAGVPLTEWDRLVEDLLETEA